MAQKSRQVVRERPEWMQKIVADNVKAATQAYQAFCDFVLAKLDLEATIDEINEKYDTHYKIKDIFSITPEQEQQVIDQVEGEDDEDDED